MNTMRTGSNLKMRSNQKWISELTGMNGPFQQQETIDELARYLYVVTYNELKKKRTSLARLNQLGDEELCDLAFDFTQQFMEKMVRDQYTLLKKYHAKGRFVAWAAKVTLNIVRSELRKASWSRIEPLQNLYVQTKETMQPEAALMNSDLRELLTACLDKLPSQTRTIFIRVVLDGESTSSIAAEMGVTPNTIYLLIHRTRKKMQKLLLDAGFEQSQNLSLA